MTFDKRDSLEAGEEELKQVLQNFRQSVHAWSEAEYARPHSVKPAAMHHTWKWALTWAMGCVLAIGGLGVGLYEHHQQQMAGNSGSKQEQPKQVLAPAAPAASAVKNPVAATVPQVAKTEAAEPDFNLLASVDSDVSRQVPSAMEPLAQLMESEVSQ